MNTPSFRQGFSLIEMLVVIAILATLVGMMSYNFAKPEVRRQSVRLAAEELASTFRKARILAMERKAVHAVVFHIQNKPGSSGLVLNNRSGGHWYRLLGPASADYADRSQTWDDLPRLANGGYGMKPHNVTEVGELMNRAWIEDPHVLTAGKVRFLALGDMDYGDSNPNPNGFRDLSTDPSYPRPWFGWYDATAKRLYPWGGYDPAIAGSGFYYWGTNKSSGAIAQGTADPQPTGCLNPITRMLDHWTVGQGNEQWNSMAIPSHPAPGAGSDTLYVAGSPRPLVNAEWRDCSLVFLSTGEVRWGNWNPVRHCSDMIDGITATTLVPARRGIFDRGNGTTEQYSGSVNQHTQAENGNFDATTGGWFITMAPDAVDDNDRFSSAQAALESISPMYRVFISRLGEVKVIPVSRQPNFNGLTAFPPTAAWWRTSVNLRKNFPADQYVDGTVMSGIVGVGVAQGQPITNFVTSQMLSERQVWMK